MSPHKLVAPRCADAFDIYIKSLPAAKAVFFFDSMLAIRANYIMMGPSTPPYQWIAP
jgi:hypothetical protein